MPRASAFVPQLRRRRGRKALPSGALPKKLLFYNLVRQKGQQYTLALFVSMLLIAVTVFSVCFNGSSLLESRFCVREDPYDFAVFSDRETDFDEAELRHLAKQNDIAVTKWRTLRLLLLRHRS